MELTLEQMYDAYEGSREQRLVGKLGKDVYGIRQMTPEQAINSLTDERIEEVADTIAKKLTDLDNGELGIRKDLLKLGLTERYQGLRNNLLPLKGDSIGASQEIVKKMLGIAPREVMLLILNADTDEKVQLYVDSVVESMINVEDDKMFLEILYFAINQINSDDNGLEAFKNTIIDVINRLELFRDYILEGRYYNPVNLTNAIVTDLKQDLRYKNIREFPIDVYINTDTSNELYKRYLDIVKPIKETKALERLIDDVKELVNEDEEALHTIEESNIIFKNNILVMLRDGLTVVDKSGEATHYASSKVKKSDIAELGKALEG